MRDFPGISDEDAELLEAATAAARAAAEAHAAARPDRDAWTEKGRADFVTEVDREAERGVVGLLRARFPDHAVLAEEDTQAEGPDPGSAAVRWIVDPLDGTTNWLHGYPEYAVSIAAVDDRGLRLGVVLNSATSELFRGVRGAGARRDGEPIRVSGVDDLRLVLAGTGFPFKKPGLMEAYLATLGRALRATSGVRRAGSAALDLCDVACGRLDAFFEYWLMPWDVAAGALILREAGGVFRPLEVPGLQAGEPADPGAPELRPGGYVAANDRILQAWLGVVEGREGQCC
jgi:myo-inositol-1(or 4)-monophosphatase